jgi:Holliday junction resolvase-like predicted endonuclease
LSRYGSGAPRRSAAPARASTRASARILAAARHYLGSRDAPACRCDVLALDALDPARIEWIKDAFGA